MASIVSSEFTEVTQRLYQHNGDFRLFIKLLNDYREELKEENFNSNVDNEVQMFNKGQGSLIEEIKATCILGV